MKTWSIGGSLRAEQRISAAALAASAGVSASTIERLVRLGMIESAEPGSDEFAAATALRLKRMLRLHDDLGVNLAGAAIIVDLLERLERLEDARIQSRGAP
jgi:chaperone modulatory protein CbpM